MSIGIFLYMINRRRRIESISAKKLNPDTVLIVIPVAFALLCLIIGKSGFYPIFSNPLGYDQDPAYVYLYSGLAFLHGEIPHHVDHPGTTFQIFLSAVILLGFLATCIESASFSWPNFTSFDKLDSFVYNYSEFIMAASGVTMCLLIAFFSYLLAKEIYRFSASIAAALTSQLFLFSWTANSLSAAGPDLIAMRAIYPAPESMLILLTLAGLLLLTQFVAKSLYAKNHQGGMKHRSNAPLIGIIAALGLFTKITFIPFLPLILAIQGDELRKALKYFLSSSLLMSLIIMIRIPYLAGWLFRNATHVGRYGSGEAGFMNSNNISRFFQILSPVRTFIWAPSLIIVMLLIIIGFIGRTFWTSLRVVEKNADSQSAGHIEPAWEPIPPYAIRCVAHTYTLFAVSLAIGLLMLLKSPEVHYFIPTIIITYYIISVTIGLLELIVNSRFKHNGLRGKERPWISRLGFYATLGISTMAIICSFSLTPGHLQISRNNATHVLSDNDHFVMGDQYYCTYGIPNKRCSVAFALSYNPYLAGKELYSGVKYFNIWGNSFNDFGSRAEIKAGYSKPQVNFTIAIKKPFLHQAMSFFESNRITLVYDGDLYQLWRSRLGK